MKKPTRNIANQEGISLRQSYSRVTPNSFVRHRTEKVRSRKKGPGLEANLIIDLRYYLCLMTLKLDGLCFVTFIFIKDPYTSKDK